MSKFDNVPTSTALISRLQVFEPRRKPEYDEFEKRVIKTQYGQAEITGRLGQAHADVLESILFNIEEVVEITDDYLIVLGKPYKVRISAGGGKQFSGSQLDVITKQLMSAVIDIRANGVKVFGHIIDLVEVVENDEISPLAKAGIGHGKKTLWKVTIGKGYLQILKDDLMKIRRDPIKIARISNGISQAITRFCKTHSNTPNGGWKLNGLIDAVGGGNGTAQALKDRRREVRKDAPAMLDCGVKVEGDRVILKGKND